MRILTDPDYRKFILILIGVFISGGLIVYYFVPDKKLAPEIVRVPVPGDTVKVYSNIEDEKRKDSLVWEIEKRDDKLVYDHNLIVKLTNKNHEQALIIDSLSKSDIYNWVQKHSPK